MRFLNRIIFINSASIKYAEVKLDGNVHFIGTQGVGKSTLLRAILFFYNADKNNLGIPKATPQGKKSFDDYYFPKANSYIVYEVKKGDFEFFVLAFRNQGRASFRFFDTAFDRNLLIDDQGGVLEQGQIRNTLGQRVNYSNIVNNYQEYRDIIYGNNRGLDQSFRKYSILESKQYHSIPRTIQNVFLNSKLDAEFIKETIIKSLDEDEIKIDLETYAHSHLRDFETELHDVNVWQRANAQGELIVKKQADQILQLVLHYKALEAEKTTVSKQLGWVMQHLENQQPKIDKELQKNTEKKDNLITRQARQRKSFEEKKERIQRKLNVLDNDLKKAKDKKQAYEKQDIEGIIQRVNKQATLEDQQKVLAEEKQLLTARFTQIEHKYQALINQANNALAKFKNDQNERKNSLNEAFFQWKEELRTRFEEIRENIRVRHENSVNQALETIQIKESKITELERKKAATTYERFYEEDLTQLRQQQQQLQQDKVAAEQTIKKAQENIEYTQQKWTLEQEALEHKYQIKRAQLDQEQKAVLDQMAKIEAKIADSKDSLYGWLSQHVPDWPSHIGKVIDEERVLFAKNLHPKLNPTSGKATNKNAPLLSFYGVELDLSQIDKKVNTVQDYEADLERLGEQVNSLKRKLHLAETQLEKDQANLKKKHQTEINHTKNQIKESEYQAEQLQLKLDELTVGLEELQEKANREKKAALTEIEAQLELTRVDLSEAQNTYQALKQGIQKEINRKKQEHETQIDTQVKAKEQKVAALQEEVQQQVATTQQRVQKLKQQQTTELQEEGVNTDRIDEIETQLADLQQTLDFIKAHTGLVFEYQKDKRDFIDKIDEFKDDKANWQQQLTLEKTAYDQKKAITEEKLKEVDQALVDLNQQHQALEEDMEEFERFKQTPWFEIIAIDMEDYNKQDQTNERAKGLMDVIRQKVFTSNKALNDLKASVNAFTSNFKEKNIFHFKTNFNRENDYLAFAEGLKEFIAEDKITEFYKRVNQRFIDIIRQIARETSELKAKEGKISQIVHKINQDFASRNFVQAIKHVELRLVESSNRVMMLLLEIKKFFEEHLIELGDINLFAEKGSQKSHERTVKLLQRLVKEMDNYKGGNELKLSDSFDLEFKIIENDNDTGWTQKLSNVGSEGTDVLVKAMINIMLLNVFKESASRNFDDFKLHCMMDEIGRLHPSNIEGILKFANARNILLINGSPTSSNPTDYKHVYKLSKDKYNVTTVKRLLSNVSKLTKLEA
ncbi:MAG TPA: ATP-binding protein [Microscillaceae bacterium]|nr:ATP-binding protein [Microscillaceae bacterium]